LFVPQYIPLTGVIYTYGTFNGFSKNKSLETHILTPNYIAGRSQEHGYFHIKSFVYADIIRLFLKCMLIWVFLEFAFVQKVWK